MPTLATGAVVTGVCVFSFAEISTAEEKEINSDYVIGADDIENSLIIQGRGDVTVTTDDFFHFCRSLTVAADTKMTLRGSKTYFLAQEKLDVQGTLVLEHEEIVLTDWTTNEHSTNNFSFSDATGGRIVMNIDVTDYLAHRLHNSFKGTLELAKGTWEIAGVDGYSFTGLSVDDGAKLTLAQSMSFESDRLSLASGAEVELKGNTALEATGDLAVESELTIKSKAALYVKEGDMAVGSADGVNTPVATMEAGAELTAEGDVELTSDVAIRSQASGEEESPVFGAGKAIDAGDHLFRLSTANDTEADKLLVKGDWKNLKDIEIENAGVLTLAGELSSESYTDKRTTLSYTSVGDGESAGTLILNGKVSGFTDVAVPSKADADGKIVLDRESTLTGEGTLTKTGAGLLVMDGNMEFAGTLAVEEGAVQWGTDSDSQNELSFDEVKLAENTAFVVAHASGSSDTNVSMDNASIVLASSSGSEDPVRMGILTVAGDNKIDWKVDQQERAGIAFAGLTGEGSLTVSPMTNSQNQTTADRTFDVGNVTNFNGSINTSVAYQYGGSAGLHFIIGAVHQDAGMKAVWNMTCEQGGSPSAIVISSSNFRKTGAGSIEFSDGIKLDIQASDDFWMRYEGDITLGKYATMNITFNPGTVLHYIGEKSLMDLVTSHTATGVLYVLAEEFSDEELLKGVNLGLKGEYRTMVNVRGQDRYKMYIDDGRLFLSMSEDSGWYKPETEGGKLKDDNDRADWDAATLEGKEAGEFGYGLNDIAASAVRITADTIAEDGASVYGGSTKALPHEAARTIETEDDGVWIMVESGKLGNVVGGNYGNAAEVYSVVSSSPFYWVETEGGFAREFVGDSHIAFGNPNSAEQPEAECIVGGNYGNSVINDELTVAGGKINIENNAPIATSFVGNSWISVNGGKVDWVCGGSYQTIFDFIHGAYKDGRGATSSVVPDPTKYSEGAFIGDAHVFIHTALQEYIETRDDSNHDFVAGGNLIDIKDSYEMLRVKRETEPKYSEANDDWWGDADDPEKGFWNHVISTPFYFIGDSYVVVDLENRYKGADTPTEFGKSIVGGDYIRNDKGWAEHIGNTYVLIRGAEDVTFTERIFGGNYDDGSSYTHLSGSTWVRIESGTFRTMIVAGSNQGSLNESKGAQGSFRQALSCVVDGETRVDITGGIFTGRTSTIKEMLPSYVFADETPAVDEDQIMMAQEGDGEAEEAKSLNHSIGRISVVGGNYISRGANAERNSTTVNLINGGTLLNITGGEFSGHIFGASVVEGNNGTREQIEGEWKVPQPVPQDGMYMMDTYYMGFRGHLYVDSVTLNMEGAKMVMPTKVGYDDDAYAPDGWVPRVVGGYMIHLAADNLVPNLLQMQNDPEAYKPMVKVGDILVNISDCEQVFDVVGGSWTACLDVSADEERDWRNAKERIPDEDPHKGSNEMGAWEDTIKFEGVEQGNITVALNKVKVKGDVIAGGIQGGVSKITSQTTTVNISSLVEFAPGENIYRPDQNIVTGGYFSARKKDFSAIEEAYEQGLISDLKWSEEMDPFDTFYEATGTDECNVSYVAIDRRLNFTEAVNYGKTIYNTILLNFDHVQVKGLGNAQGVVNAAGLLITDTRDGGENKKDTIYLFGGGEMQLVPDYMLIPEWIVEDGQTSHTVPWEADRYKWLHNNSYIVVQGEGTTLHLLQSETRDDHGAIAMKKLYDEMLHVQKLKIEQGAHLKVDQYLEDGMYQPVAVRDGITMDSGSELFLTTNIIKGEMDTVPESAIRGDRDISAERFDKEAQPLEGPMPMHAGYEPPANEMEMLAQWRDTVTAEHTVYFGENSVFSFEIKSMKKDVAVPDYVRKYLIDYVNADALGHVNSSGDEQGIIDYDGSVTQTMEKWFIEFGEYDEWNVGVIENPDHTFSLILEAWRDRNADEEPVPPTRRPHYHRKHSHTHNGAAGGDLLDEFYPDPTPDSPDREKVLDYVFKQNSKGNDRESDRVQAAVAGSSIAAIGTALADDVDRQMRLVRNRVTGGDYRPDEVPVEGGKDGKGGARVYEGGFERARNTYWVNAESDYRRMKMVSTDPGYKMTGWGGTVGMAHTTRRGIDVGMALTAMYDDFETNGPDRLKADMDIYYLSAYAQMRRKRWTHTLLGTVGTTSIDAKRTVYIDPEYGSYSTHFSTDALQLGLMYELAYTIELDRSREMYLEPLVSVAWRHVDVDGFTETGSDAALRADDHVLDSLIVRAGARIGGRLARRLFAYRPLMVEGRAVAKLQVGALRNHVDIGFADRVQRADIRSRDHQAMGAEVGGTLTVPLRQSGRREHYIFFDVNAELRGSYTDANATMGYKLRF